MPRAQPAEIQFEDPDHDYAFLEMESYSNFKSRNSDNTSASQYLRIADQISFPAGIWGNHFFFGSVKNTIISRDLVYQDVKLNEGLLQRYWLAGGIELINSPLYRSYFMAAAGLNSDFADLGSKDWNSEWIYTFAFVSNKNFKWGLGLDLQQYSGRFVNDYPMLFNKWQIAAYPLVYIDWRLTGTTKFIWDADYLELRHFFIRKLAATVGARFNLEFFALKQDASYEYRSVGAEGGCNTPLGRIATCD